MSLDKFVAMYLDWCNNYISIPFFASSGWRVEAAKILTLGKQIRDLDIEIGHLHK